MKIVWDEPKRKSNFEKHGLDFAALDLEFFEDAIVAPARNGRLKAIGKLKDGTAAAIFALLGSEGLSIISLRPANKFERYDYEKSKTSRRH